ncbi:MAG TPA: YciI family protein [Gammaproteobacteria bacterium]|nr:YciI family protein [Gammaproteobacteria bacterium]
MFYSIYCTDVPESLPLRKSAREQHLARLNALKQEGRLLLAGPFPVVDSPDPGTAGFSGSLIIAEFDALRAAQEWAEQDPYVVAGVYAEVEVKPFLKVLP